MTGASSNLTEPSSVKSSRSAATAPVKWHTSATMPTTVDTGIRSPRMHGTPPIWPGLTVTRSNRIANPPWYAFCMDDALGGTRT